MKKIVSLVIMLCVLCSAAVTGYAEIVSEEEYLAWVDKAWPVIKDIYENYSNVVSSPLKNCYYKDNQGNSIYPNLDFLLLSDIRLISQEQYEIMDRIGFTRSEEGREGFNYLHTFFNEVGDKIFAIQSEYETLGTIPESCSFIDSNISTVLGYIVTWYNGVCTVIEEGYGGFDILDKMYEEGTNPYLSMYGDMSDEAVIKESKEKNISYTDAMENIGIRGNMNVLYTLLG